jgi:Mg2+ and Co2+ transporter CorA
VSWYALDDPNDPQLDELATRFQLHPLHIEDCRGNNERLKAEGTDNYLFLILKYIQSVQDGEIGLENADHSLRLLDMVETLRDLLNNTFDVYLSSVANRTNQVMKVLTVLSTIALPALVISGIYGMNLKDLPFLESNHGTEIIVGAMIASTGVVLWMLKRFGWL